MSILVRGMKMPENCFHCRLMYQEYGEWHDRTVIVYMCPLCSQGTAEPEYKGERAPYCPLSPETDKTESATIRREDLLVALNDYFTIGDSYTYELNRVKEAFYIGTMSLEDFVEWDEENVSELCDYLMEKLFSDRKEAHGDEQA